MSPLFGTVSAILEEMDVGIVAVDQGRLLFVTRAAERILGAPREGLLGRPLAEAPAPLSDAEITQALQTALQRQSPIRLSEPRVFAERSYSLSVHPAEGLVWLLIRETPRGAPAVSRQSLLDRVAEILESPLDYADTVQRIAQLCASDLAEYCVVHIDEGAEVRALGIAHRDPAKEASVREMLRLFPIPTQGGHPVVEVLRTGEPRLFPRIDAALLESFAGESRHVPVMRSLDLTSALLMPLTARGRTLGSISLARAGGAPAYSAEEVGLVAELARRVALAVDNARLYREARREAEARELTLGVVSHDLRNALHAAAMHSEMLVDLAPERLAEGAGRRQLEVLRRTLDYMHRLVQDLLDVESMESGRLSLHPGPLDLYRLGEDLEQMFSPLAAERQVELRVSFSEGLPTIEADAMRVVQVLTNLISNALAFTPAGGTVWVEADPQADRVRFRVRDTGVGIAEADLPYVFERHWRGEPLRSPYAGSGLGLTIVRGIVQAHGGEVWAESTLRQGSSFWFTLPFSSGREENGPA